MNDSHQPRRVNDSRMSRLHGGKPGSASLTRRPVIERGAEVRTALIFAGLMAGVAIAWGLVSYSGAISEESDSSVILPFSLGFLLVCGFSSSLAFLSGLRNRLLLLCAGAGAAAIAFIALDVTPLESLAKVIFATTAGLWIGMLLTSISQVLIIAGLIIVVDIYSVFAGPTKAIVESGSRAVGWLTISLPVFGVDRVSLVGISDIIFFSLFIVCTLTYRLRRTATALAMSASFIATMVVGISFDRGVPALPLLSLAFILANADLLYRRFLHEPDDQREKRKGNRRSTRR